MQENTESYPPREAILPPPARSFRVGNLALLQAREPAQDCLPGQARGEETGPQPEWLPGPFPAIRVPGEDGRLITLNSPREPWKEAGALLRAARLQPGRPVAVLGLGLGYHVLALLDGLDADQVLIVVERRREVFAAALQALDLAPLLTRPRTILAVSANPQEVAGHLRRTCPEAAAGNVQYVSHPPSRRADPEFYRAVRDGLAGSPRTDWPRSRRLHKDKLRFLILNTDYFLIPEVTRALGHLGHEVQRLFIDKQREQGGEVVRRILHLTAQYRPDLIFTINHLGFDREGILIDAFSRAGIPSVSWYVDSPRIILNLYQGPASDLVHIFLWDRSYRADVERQGFSRVHELPLATDPGIFRPRSRAAVQGYRSGVSFVGNSMVGPTQKKLSRLPQDKQFLTLFAELVKIFRERPFQRLHDVLTARGWRHHPALANFTPKQWTDLEAGLIWLTTRDYRLECVRRLAAVRPVIYGDPGWQELLAPPCTRRPEVNYYDELPLVFAGSQINFNATSLQMQTAVNQRVFDVPAAGGFLLTDYREQLGELFDLGKDVICYRQPAEIPELAQFYLRHDRERRRVQERGRQRVLQEHTYVHRMRAMLDVLRRAT